jgi:hypothetical protein
MLEMVRRMMLYHTRNVQDAMARRAACSLIGLLILAEQRLRLVLNAIWIAHRQLIDRKPATMHLCSTNWNL